MNSKKSAASAQANASASPTVRLFKVLRTAGSQVCATLWIVQVAAGVIGAEPVTRQFTDELYPRAWVLGVVEEPYQAFAGNFEERSEEVADQDVPRP